MNKIAILLCALFSLTATASGAGGGPIRNGVGLNGIWENGVWQNGVALSNGISLNGWRMQGTWLNGINLNTLQLKGVTYQGLRWDPSAPATTGLKVTNAAARGGRLFIRK